MLSLLFALLLTLQFVAGDDPVDRQHGPGSASSPHVLSQLLVKVSPKFALRATSDGCATGWRELGPFPLSCPPTDSKIYLDVCPNFPDECAPDGSFCVCLFATR